MFLLGMGAVLEVVERRPAAWVFVVGVLVTSATALLDDELGEIPLYVVFAGAFGQSCCAFLAGVVTAIFGCMG